MEKRELLERGLHKWFSEYSKRQQSKKIVQKNRQIVNLWTFSQYLWYLIKKHKWVEDYVNNLYAKGKDIMRLYSFFMTSRGNSFEKARTLATKRFESYESITNHTLAEHISLIDDYEDDEMNLQ